MSVRTSLLLAAKIALSAALLWLVLFRIDTHQVLDRLQATDLRFVGASYLVFLVVLVLSAWRWYVLAPGLLTFGRSLRYTVIGTFFGHLLPGGVSGDIAKGISLAMKERATRVLSLPASIVVDKLVGFAVLIALFDLVCAALYLGWQDAYGHVQGLALAMFAIGAIGVIGLLVGAWLVAGGRLVRLTRAIGLLTAMAARVTEAVEPYLVRPRLLMGAAAISVAIHACNALSLYLSLRAIAIDPPGLLPLIVYPVLAVALTVPVSILGIGVREAVLVGFFAVFGLPGEAALAGAWLAVLMLVPILLIGAAVQVAEIYRRSEAH